MGDPTLRRYIQIREASGYKRLEACSLGITDTITDLLQPDPPPPPICR